MNRALILSSLAHSKSRIENPSKSEDSLTLLKLLGEFGVQHEWDGEILWIDPSHFAPPKGVELDVGPAGTVMRFITAFAACCEGAEVTVRGSERMHKRPIGPLIDALRSLGAEIEYAGEDGFPPLRVIGRKLQGGRVEIDGGVSSQFLTALLLVGATLEEGLELVPIGELISQSYLRMTCQTLKAFGISSAEREGGGYIVSPQTVQGAKYLVEGDASGASYLWGLAAVTGGEISLRPFPKKSFQGDVQFPELLERMGCAVEVDDAKASIAVKGPRGERLRGISIDMEDMPDTAQTLAVVAAIAEGRTEITGLKTLRIKETDRIAAVQKELSKVGVKSGGTDESLTIEGTSIENLSPASIATYEDHRMAMAFSLLGALISGIEIEEPEVVGKSFPDFWERLKSIGVAVS